MQPDDVTTGSDGLVLVAVLDPGGSEEASPAAADRRTNFRSFYEPPPAQEVNQVISCWFPAGPRARPAPRTAGTSRAHQRLLNSGDALYCSRAHVL